MGHLSSASIPPSASALQSLAIALVWFVNRFLKGSAAFDALGVISSTRMALLEIKLSARNLLPCSLFIILQSRKNSLICYYLITPVEIFPNQELEGIFLKVKI